MSDNGSRILTVSAGGTVQLWNEQGEQIQKIEWADQAGGASGYPDAQTLILGSYGIAATHNNQIVVLNLTDGSVLAKKNTDAMFINRLIPFGKDRVFVGFSLWDWHGHRAAELTLPDGDLHAVPDLDDMDRAGPNYWVSGSKSPFTLHRAFQLPAEMPLDPSCMPIDAHFCSWREIPDRTVHVLDVQHGKWQHFNAGKILEGTDSVDVVPAGSALFGILCGRGSSGYPRLRPCVVRDLETGRDLHEFQGDRFRAVGTNAGNGTPEIRLVVYTGNAARIISVSQDGRAFTLAASEAAWLGASGSDLLISSGPNESALVSREGKRKMGFPFPSSACGNGWPNWTTQCKISADGRRWLVATDSRPNDQDNDLILTMYESSIAPR